MPNNPYYNERGYHVDKNGKEISRCKLIHDDGTIYDLVGTGLYLAGNGHYLSVWTPDNKLRTVDTRKCRVYHETDGFTIMVVLFAAFIILGTAISYLKGVMPPPVY